MHKIDEKFSERRNAIEKSRKMRLWRRISLTSLAVIVLGAASTYLFFDGRDNGMKSTPPEAGEASEAQVLAAYAPDIIDLAGAPLHIELPDETAASSKLKWQPSPAVLKKFGITGAIAVLREPILPTGRQIMLKVPSTQRDFAFFETQKAARTDSTGDATAITAETNQKETGDPSGTPLTKEPDISLEAGDAVSDKTTDEWGELNGANLPAEETMARTGTVENNVSAEYLIGEASRRKTTGDSILQVMTEVQIKDFLITSNVTPVIAKFAGDAVFKNFAVSNLPAGSVIALRFSQQTDSPAARSRLVQIALYSPGHYIGALATAQDGTFTPSVDPWADKDLSGLDKSNEGARPTQKFRLIDGIYSAAIRNGTGTRIAGEAIMQLARSYDLAEYANQSDWITLIYSAAARETDSNKTNILYIGIDRADGAIKCYVNLLAESNRFGCINENATTEVTTAQSGMVIPVAGVMTSPFGPRIHPILKKVLVHQGVDWAAPIGTPVRAAYSGVVVFEGDKGTFGNFIRLKHSNGLATSYAHLSAFAKDLVVGKSVKAGDLIGYIGTTGRSTGPHLHFEAYRNNATVDPLAMNVVEVGEAQAIKGLLDRIIRVESGGNANARNSKSTATGLGQFLESTWIRMISSYRPELMSSMSRTDVLALRTDPTVSKEMLGNLARENEDYLKSRGHQITAARLYLAHFLGAAGADVILKSPADTPVATLAGPQVMKANPHLLGMTVADINAWTERVMGRGKQKDPDVTQTKVTATLRAEYVEYKNYVDLIVLAAPGNKPR